MNITVFPQKLSGSISAKPSKSQAHRLLICASFADSPTMLYCSETNADIEATADCLRALGASIIKNDFGYAVRPVEHIPQQVLLHCRESGSTLRFMLPLVGALGIDASFLMEGRLPDRPLSPLWEEMERMGCTLTREAANMLRCRGKLCSGDYTLDGSVSSQFITGLLLAGVLIDGPCRLAVTGKLESRPYVDMTVDAMLQFGVDASGFIISQDSHFHSPGSVVVEGDWSNAAFFLGAQALGSSVQVDNLDNNSLQGDRICTSLFQMMETGTTIDVSDIPDLVPILSIVAAAKQGALFTNINRLRLKESDRVASVIDLLKALGGQAIATENTLQIFPSLFHSGTVDSHADHRIAMSAAIAATIATGPVTIIGADCVCKSYPNFWYDYSLLGGHYEQYIR